MGSYFSGKRVAHFEITMAPAFAHAVPSTPNRKCHNAEQLVLAASVWVQDFLCILSSQQAEGEPLTEWNILLCYVLFLCL